VAEAAVNVQGLTKRFGGFTAVDGIDLRVEQGEIFGFVGPNGSGKSTTIRMLIGLLTPSAGQGQVLGLNVVRQAEAIRHHIGYMSQKFSLYDELSAGENLAFYAYIYGLHGAVARQRMDEVLALVELAGIEKTLTQALSTGWKQRLALACALIHAPRLLFLDEPTGGVDPLARRHFWDLLYQLCGQGVTVFVTTHYMDEADYCHHLAFINEGKIIADGPPERLKRNWEAPDLEALFARLVEAQG